MASSRSGLVNEKQMHFIWKSMYLERKCQAGTLFLRGAATLRTTQRSIRLQGEESTFISELF